MLSREARKESIRQFKEQKTTAGIYAVRSSSTGSVWVGGSRNLGATQNGCWFTLRNGSHIEKPLQMEWNAAGESAFTFEVLEAFDEDLHPLEAAEMLKTRKAAWVEQLNAKPLL